MALLIPFLRCFLKAGTCVLPRVQPPLLAFQAAKTRSPYGKQKEFTDTIFYKLCENEGGYSDHCSTLEIYWEVVLLIFSSFYLTSVITFEESEETICE